MKLTRKDIEALPPARRAMLLQLLQQQQSVPAPAGPLLVRRGRGAGPARASYAQERMWVLWELEREGTAYHISGVLRLRGQLEGATLEWALNEIIARHEALRTRFGVIEGELRQIVEPRWRLELREEDARGETEGEWRRRVEQEAQRPFDLRQLPLMRVRLLRTAEREWVLGVVMHHIVADGWSLGVLEGELCRLYSARREGREACLGELPVQYSDWAQWQREALTEERLKPRVEWWRERLEGGARRLWWGRLGRSEETSPASHVAVDLGRELSAGLRDLARRQATTLHMVLAAGVAASLHRYTGQEEVRLGLPVAGRGERETEGLIGLFVNTVVVPVRVSGRRSFTELLEGVKQALLGSYERQDVPYEKVVEAVRSGGGTAEGRLFDLLLGFQNAPRAALELTGVEARHEELASRQAKFDLSLLLEEQGEGVSGTLEYRESRYERGLMEAWVGDLKRCLTSAVCEPQRALSEVELLEAHEQQRVVVEWNGTRREWGEVRSLTQWIEEQARRRPEAVAVTSGAQGLSYAELNAGANRLARWLRRRGVGPEQRVGVWLRRGVGMVQAALAVMKAGGAYVPLDERYPQGRLEAMLEDAGVRLLLSEAGLGERLGVAGVELVPVDELGAELWRESGEDLGLAVERDNLAYVLYTSGSTGVPKGVMLTHRGALNLVGWTRATYGAEALREVLFSTSLCFDLSVYEVWGTLSCGGRVVVVDDVLGASGERVGLINTVPSAMRELLRLGSVPGGVRTVNLAGEALDGELVRGIYAGSGAERVMNLYGPTETTTYSTQYELKSEWCQAGEAWAPIGVPLANTRVYVLDRELRLLPVGVYGELCIGGEGVARGYLNRGALTAERFVPEPWGEPGSRMYRTGDRVRWRSSGELEYAGRLDQQVKVRGYRIEPGEIESAARGQEWVDEAVVLARGEAAQRRLVGYATVKRGATASVEELRRRLRERLPEYMVPGQWVVLERLPLTANGKLDRRRLPEPEESGGRTGREATTPVERTLAGIWRELLKRERVGAEESFFELGGHSLLATQVVARVREVYGVELPLRRMFEAPRIADLARVVEEMLLERVLELDDPRVAEASARLAAMSDDQVQAALAEATRAAAAEAGR